MCDLSFITYWSGTRKLGVALMILFTFCAMGAAIAGLATYYIACVPSAPKALALEEECDCNDEPKPCPGMPVCEPEPCADEHPFMPAESADLHACLVPCARASTCTREHCGDEMPERCAPDPRYELILDRQDNTPFMKNLIGKKALEELNRHPVGSNERLQTALVFLKKGIMPYQKWMSRRNCRHPAKVCTICNDHYKWLTCVVYNRLIDYAHPEKTAEHPFAEPFSRSPIKSTNGSTVEENIKWFTSNAFQNHVPSDKKKPYQLAKTGNQTYFEDLGVMQTGLSFLTDTDEVCTVCSELSDVSQHIECIAKGYDFPWYRHWAWFKIENYW